MKENKLLMIINEFPPTGESGVQRALKFLKYACQAGWDVYAIVPKKPVRKETDFSLLEEIPSQAHICKVGGLGIRSRNVSRIVSTRFADTTPSNLAARYFWSAMKLFNDLIFPLDKQIGWMPFAYTKAVKLIKRHSIRNVYITAYPYSAFTLGLALKKRFKDKIFWVADYRDVWQFAPLLDKFVLPFRKRYIIRKDDQILKTCDQAVFVTNHIREQYLQKHPWLADKSSVITNGYDEADFTDLHPVTYSKFTVFYMGRMDRNYGDPIQLMQALASCGLTDFQFIHMGSVDPVLLARINNCGFEFYHYEGYKSHKEVLNYAAGSNINVIMLNDDPASEGVYTGKLFELLRIGRPILSLGPQKSVVADLLHKTGAGIHAHISDIDQICAAINKLADPGFAQKTDLIAIQEFSRQNLTSKLLDLYSI